MTRSDLDMFEESEMCSLPRCRREAAIRHLGTLLCQEHWEALCRQEADHREKQQSALERSLLRNRRCTAYLPSGHLCGEPATRVDARRGLSRCPAHDVEDQPAAQ